MKTIKEAVYEVFMLSGADYKELSLDDIALEIQDKDPDYKGCDIDVLRKRISSHLGNATTKTLKGKRVEDKDSIYERVKNGKGGYKKGIYRLRKPKRAKPNPQPKPMVTPTSNPIQVESLYMGAAGEMAVCSELLFREYNVSRMPVDDGIDIVAMKNNKTYYIQVKTVQVKTTGFGVQIKSSSYNKYNSNDCYYIIVARGENTQFIVATADDIRRWINHKDVTQGDKSISIRFTQNVGSLFVGNENIEQMVNAFGKIK